MDKFTDEDLKRAVRLLQHSAADGGPVTLNQAESLALLSWFEEIRKAKEATKGE